MLAPSFQKMSIVSNQYQKNGKWYIDVRNESTGATRSVRWYTDAEYGKLYGNKVAKREPGIGIDAPWEFYYSNEGNPGLKQAMGFSKGPILVIRGNKSKDEEWLRRSVARYSAGIGWYITSEENLPSDIPAHFKFLLLGWNEFKLDETHSKKPSQLAEILLKKASNREYVHF